MSNLPPAQTAYVAAAGRLLIAAIFLLSGFGKVAAPAATLAYITAQKLPFPLGAYLIALTVELGGSLLLVIGYRARIVASVIALYCLAAALGFHRDLADQDQFINFFKNVAMAGGLLQITAFGAGRLSVDARRGRA